MARDGTSGIRIEGLQQTIKSLEALGVDIADLKAAFAVIGDEALRQATRFAPRASGALIRSLKVSKSKNRVNLRVGNARVKYGAVQNYGWPKHSISASHFLQKADSAVQPIVIPTLERELSKLIDQQGLSS